MIVLMMFQMPCSTMWIVGLTIRHPLLRHLLPLPPVWRLPAPRIVLSVPSVLPPSVGGSFSTPSLPPLWCLGGGGSRRSFGCAAPSVLHVWAGVAAVSGVPLGGVLGGCCGLSPLCCSSSSGRGWLPSCSGRSPRLCAACAVAVLCGWRRPFFCLRCPRGGWSSGRKVKYDSVRVLGLGFGNRDESNLTFSGVGRIEHACRILSGRKMKYGTTRVSGLGFGNRNESNLNF